MTIKAVIVLVFVITTLDAKDYRGAEYRTKNYFTYGRFEVRLKSAQREGMLTSFFTYNDSFPTTPWNEIDIEILGRYKDDVQFNPITPGQVNHEVHYQTSFNPSHEFHVYAFEWTPKYVAWFIDGKEVHRQTGAHIEALRYPQKIMLNVWNPIYANWVGTSSAYTLPAFAFYDWVSYASYTPDSGNVGTNNNFKVQWKDDFNSFDAIRWAKASHTWNGNQCDLYPDNVVFKDGMMILCLTTNTTSGYVDATGPWVSSARAEYGKIKVRYTEEVETISAETPANYIVPGNTVLSAKLQPDLQTVYITLAKYDTSTLSNIVIVNTKDRFSPPNTLIVRNISIDKQKPISFPIKINCGGTAYTDYVADQEWSSKVEYGYVDGKSNQNTAQISGTPDATIYHSDLTMPVKYFIRVPNGTYDVEFQMAETFFSNVGSRIFSIAVQNNVVVQNLDLVATVGKNTAYTKIVKNITVTDEVIDIHFLASVNYAFINGIIINQVATKVNDRLDYQPHHWNIGQNYPNPFNGSTVIPFSIADEDNVSLQFFDTLGRIVDEKNLGTVGKGDHSFLWNAKSKKGTALSSGVYFYLLKGNMHTSVKKLLLVQ